MSVQGDYVRQNRIHAGLSVSEFARRVGVSHSQVSRIESGNRYVDFGYMPKFAETLNVPLVDLLLTSEAFQDSTVAINSTREKNIFRVRRMADVYAPDRPHSARMLVLMNIVGVIADNMAQGDMLAVESSLLDLAALSVVWAEQITAVKGTDEL